MKGKVFYGIFFGLFVLVGLGVGAYGFARLGIYNAAEQVPATVLSAEYDYTREEFTVSFIYEKEGDPVQGQAALREKIKYDNGKPNYYAGKEIVLHLDRSGEVVQFGKVEILATVTGCLFFVVGAGFLYFGVLRKPSMLDYAYEYERAMVPPEEVTDETGKYEARADELSRRPQKSFERVTGELGVWGNRMKDRFKTYTVFEHVLIACYFILPMIVFSLYPMFVGGRVTKGIVSSAVFGWFFVACILGMIGKLIYSLWWKLLVKSGKFKEKQLATVVRCAFDSSLEFSVGRFARTHTVFKKFKVVATVNGKRSIGYVKGNLPPPQGAVLKVLVCPHQYGHWIIDTE